MEFPKVSQSRRQFLTEATEAYYKALGGSPGATYLKGRGFTGEMAKHFQLGYVAEPLEGHASYKGWLSIPYITPAGVVAIRFRRIGEGEPKYLQESGSRTPLFNVRDLHRREEYVAICEGEPDTMTLSFLCGIPSVGIGGVDQWNNNEDVWKRLFEDYERVYVVSDPDEAGQKMAAKICKAIRGYNPINVILPADVNETYCTFGADFIKGEMGL